MKFTNLCNDKHITDIQFYYDMWYHPYYEQNNVPFGPFSVMNDNTTLWSKTGKQTNQNDWHDVTLNGLLTQNISFEVLIGHSSNEVAITKISFECSD